MSLLQAVEQCEKELKAAKQRELELLAVIERLADDWDDLLEDMELHGMHKFEPYIKSKAKFKNRPGLSQALREHEAKVLEEAADWFDEMFYTDTQEAKTLRRMAEERRNNG